MAATNEEMKEAEDAALDVKTESIVPEHIRSKLREEFPVATHYSQVMDENFTQTGVKPAYVVERLNEVLGIEGWEAEEVEIREKEKHIATKVKLTIYMTIKNPQDGTITKFPIASRTQWGSAKMWPRSEYGDVLKSALTNAICKCASLFDVAHEAYKGLLKPVAIADDVIDESDAKAHDETKKKATKKAATKKASSAEQATDKPANTTSLKALRKELLGLFTKKGLTRNALQQMMKDNFGKEESRELDEGELSGLVALVKDMPNESYSEDGESNTEQVAETA